MNLHNASPTAMQSFNAEAAHIRALCVKIPKALREYDRTIAGVLGAHLDYSHFGTLLEASRALQNALAALSAASTSTKAKAAAAKAARPEEFLKMDVPKIGELKAENLRELVTTMQRIRDERGYGQSDIGSRWAVVNEKGDTLGHVSYNGRWWPKAE